MIWPSGLSEGANAGDGFLLEQAMNEDGGMPLKDLLFFVWGSVYGLTFSLAVGFLIRPRLGKIFKENFALGLWSFGMAVVTIIWMLSYLSATFWELNILDATFSKEYNPQFSISHIVLPLLLGFAFSVLVAHSWKLYVVLPAAIVIGFFDLIGMSTILYGIASMLVKQATAGEQFSHSQTIIQDYFLGRPHLQGIAGYMIIIAVGVGLAVLSLGKGLFRDHDHEELSHMMQAIERNRTLFDRLSRSCFMLAILGNEILIWYWRIERTEALREINKPWWF